MTEINLQLIEVIFNLSRLMKDQMASHSELATLSFLQIQTLVFVAKNKAVSMSDIAQNFNIELPSATSLIQKLVKAELLERKTDPKDRRIVKILLTKEGKTLLKTIMKHRKKKIQQHLSLLSDTEKKQLLKILKKMIVKMEEYEK